MTVPIPAQFFTLESLGAFAGATGATFIVTNTIQSVAGISAKWIGLCVSEAVCLTAAYIADAGIGN